MLKVQMFLDLVMSGHINYIIYHNIKTITHL